MRQEASPRAEASVEDVYRDHAPRLWRAVLGYAGDPDVASEAVAEAFAQLIARQKRAPVDSPAGWVWTAAFRIAAGLLQRSAQLPVEDQSAYELPEPVVDLVRTLARLPERQRIAVVLHDYADRPTAEVANVMGIAKPTVYVHLRNGRQRLRELWGERP